MFYVCSIFAGDCQITVEITGVRTNNGNVFVSIYSNESEMKKDDPYALFVLPSQDIVLSQAVVLPQGEYVIAVYQDLNHNGELDTNFLGVPKEPIGMTNYNGGLRVSFDRLKVPVNNATSKITVNIRN